MKKTLLVLAMTTTFSSYALSATAAVDHAKANQATAALINQQMQSIDAHVLAQLERQSNNVAVIDDVVYEKQPNGKWAVVGGASAALLTGLLSSTSSPNDHVDALPELPINHPSANLPHIEPDSPTFDQYSITETNTGWHVVDNHTGANVNVDDKGNIHDAHTGDVIANIVESNSGYEIHNAEGQRIATYSKSTGLVFLDVEQTPSFGTAPKDNPIFEQFTISESNTGWHVVDNHTGANVDVDDKGNIRDTNTGDVIGNITESTSGYEIHNADGQRIATYSKSTGLVFLDVEQTPSYGTTPKDNPIHDNPEWTFNKQEDGVHGIERDGVELATVEKQVDTRGSIIVVEGKNDGIAIYDINSRTWTANEEAKSTIKSIAQQPRFDQVRNKARARMSQ